MSRKKKPVTRHPRSLTAKLTSPATVPPPAVRYRPWFVAGLIALAIGVLIAIHSRYVGLEREPAMITVGAARSQYVGSQACVGCHAREYEAWRGSHHERAMLVANEETVLGNFANAKFSHAGVRSTFFRRNGRFHVNTDGPDGRLSDYEIKYTFGLTPLQQYLIEFPDGRIQALSIAWDTRPKEQGGQRWFHLYPGQRIAHDDPLHWTGSSQNWNFMCADCHSTNVRRNYDPANDRFATTWSEINVACEACHGPGSKHLEWAGQGESSSDRRTQDNGLVVQFAEKPDWAIDPATGNARPSIPRESQAELQTCAPCHARRAQIAEGHLPGKPLLDSYLVSLLERDLYEADGQMRDEVYNYGSFLQSAMHARGVSCGDCHEPHSLELRADGNALCVRCHAATRYDTPGHHRHEEDTQATHCTSCHMPVRTYMVVDPRHDHSFRIPRPDLSVDLGTPNACNDCHADKNAAWAASTVETWHGPGRKGFQGFAPAIAAARNESLESPGKLRQTARDESQPAIARATALAELAPYLTPSVAVELRGDLSDPDPLVRLGALRGLAGLAPEERWSFAATLLEDPVRAVRIEAASFLAAVPMGRLSAEERTRLERAISEYIAVQTLNADRPEAHLNLGLLYAQRGDATKAGSEYRTAIERDRRFIPAYVNLADLYRIQGRDAEGERVLNEALALAPDDASLQHALGLLLVREKNLEEALQWLERAAGAATDNARYAYVYGIALSSTGRTNEAIRVLDDAQRRHPGNRELLYALVTINRDAGRIAAARAYAEQLAALAIDDPLTGRLLEELDHP